MQLVVARGDLAVRRNHIGAVGDALWLELHGERAHMQEDAKLGRQRAQAGKRRALLLDIELASRSSGSSSMMAVFSGVCT